MEKIDELKNKELNFKIWEAHKNVAMHFNSLLIKLRVQALGLITLIISVGGLILKSITLNTLD